MCTIAKQTGGFYVKDGAISCYREVLCDDASLPVDDPTDPAYHRYVVKSNAICNAHKHPGCTPDTGFQIMMNTPAAVAPLREGVGKQRVEHCGILLLATFPTNALGYDNRIRTVVDVPRRSVMNVTLPKHVFYPGRVIRQVILESGVVKVQTIGTGSDTGWKRFMNIEAAPFVWEQHADDALKKAVEEYLKNKR